MSRFRALTLCAVSCAAAANAREPREVELKKARAEFWKCFASGDATGLATIVTDDFVQFSETAKFVDKATLLTIVKTRKYSQVENPTLDDVVDPRVRFYGNSRHNGRPWRWFIFSVRTPRPPVAPYGTVAIVTDSAPLAAEHSSIDAATPRTRVTEVWAKVKGKGLVARWMIANMQVTRPMPAPVASAAK
jgi:hypothetical protein